MSVNDATDSEEEILVYAEFEESVDIESYRSIHVLGIDEQNPIIQTDDTFFTGKYENSLGTYMFFEEDPTPESADPLFDRLPEKCLKYLFKTRKLLSMEDAFVTSKGRTDHDNQNQSQHPDDDIKPITFESVQDAIEMFKKRQIEDPVAKSNQKSQENTQEETSEPRTVEAMDED